MNHGEYRRILEVINDIRKIAGGTLRYPQVVVLGDQSSGKSSLLQSISDIPFPEGAGTVTKCPIVVSMCYDVKTHFQVDNAVCEFSELCERITIAQGKRLDQTKDVCSKEIHVTARGQRYTNLVLVDLPGIIHNGPGIAEVESMVEAYIAPLETIILVVKPADADNETQKALLLAKKHDPDTSRTIIVNTKCDVFTSDENQQRLVTEIRSELGNRLGSHAVSCRLNGEHCTAEQEGQVLEGLDLPPSRAGHQTLKSRLTSVLAQCVKMNIPTLMKQIQHKLQAANDVLHRIGDIPADSTQLLTRLQHVLHGRSATLEQHISQLTSEFKQRVEKTETAITREWVSANFHVNYFKPPFFQGESCFIACLQAITALWRPLSQDLQASTLQVLHGAMRTDGMGFCSGEFLAILSQQWHAEQITIKARLTRVCSDIILEQQDYATINHYILNSFRMSLTCPDQLVDQITAGIDASMYQEAKGDELYFRDISVVRDHLRNHIKEGIADFCEKSNSRQLEESQKEMVYQAISAYFFVMTKNYLDNVFSRALRDCVIGQRAGWIRTLMMNSSLKDAATEHPAVCSRRANALSIRDKMLSCQTRLRQLARLPAHTTAHTHARHSDTGQIVSNL